MKMIVGLGNPGLEYFDTPHNVGFETMDRIAEMNKVTITKKKKNGMFVKCEINGETVLLVKPLTFMNNSGECVFTYAKKFGLKNSDILIIYDDVELTAGLARARTEGSAGTHNGMKSIVNSLGTLQVARIRIGVGTAQKPDDLAEYVLNRMDKDTLVKVNVGIDKAIEFVYAFISNGVASETK